MPVALVILFVVVVVALVAFVLSVVDDDSRAHRIQDMTREERFRFDKD